MTDKINASTDRTNQTILQELRQDARLSWQKFGRRVHFSDQVVDERIRQPQQCGVILGTLSKRSPIHQTSKA